MENNKQSDKNIQGMFENYQPEIDTDAVWENIEPKLKKKKNRRFLLFYLLLGVGLMTTGYFYINNDTVETPLTQITENQTIAPEQADETITETIEPELVTTTNEPVSQTQKIVDSDKRKETFATSEDTDLPQLKNTTVFENNNAGYENSIKTEIENTAEVEKKSTPFFEEKDLEIEEHSIPQIDDTQKEDFNPPIEESTKKEEFFPVEKEDSEKLTEKKRPLKKKISKKKKRKKKKRKKRRINRMKRIPFRPYVQVFAAPEYAFKSISTPGSEGLSNWVNMRNSTEQQLEAFSYGANLQLVHKNGFVMLAGGEFRRINGRFKQTEIEERSVFENGIISYTVNSAGDTIDVGYGLKEKFITTEKTQIAQNYFQFLNIPIGVGYQQSGRKAGWKILGGLNLNIAYYMEASYLNRSGNLISYDNKKDRWRTTEFKQKATPNLWASFEYFRKIRPKIQWMIAPKIEVPTGGLNNLNVYPISQRFYPVSLKTGFNFLLGRAPKKKKKKKRKEKRKRNRPNMSHLTLE